VFAVLEILPPFRGITEASHDLVRGRQYSGTNFSYQMREVSLNDVDVNGSVSYATATMLIKVITTSQMADSNSMTCVKPRNVKERVMGYSSLNNDIACSVVTVALETWKWPTPSALNSIFKRITVPSMPEIQFEMTYF